MIDIVFKLKIQHGMEWHRESFREANPSNNTPFLYASFTDTVFWAAERAIYFENRIVNTDAPPYIVEEEANPLQEMLLKHQKYNKA